MTRKLPQHSPCAVCSHRARPALLTLLVLLIFAGLAGWPAGGHAAASRRDAGEGAGAFDQAAQDAAIFSDDFEAFGDSSLWNRSNKFPVQTGVVANGRFAARLRNLGANPVYGRASFDSSHKRLFVRMRFSILEQSSPSVTLINLRATREASVLSISLDATGTLSYLTGATGVTSSSAVSVESGAWHELQVLVDVSSETGNVRVWLDNAELTTLRQQVWLGDRGVRYLDLGDNSAGQMSDIAYDDVIADDKFIPVDRQADPVPGTLVVNTYPKWQNIPFELDGHIYYSGYDGTVEIPVARWSTDLRSRIKVRDAYRGDGSLAVFTGWKHWYSVHSRDVYAAFRVSKPVTFSFVDGAGEPVDPSLIDQLTLKSKSGDLLKFQGEQLTEAVLIPVQGTAFGPSGIEIRNTTYVVDEVIINGSNAVHRSQQRSKLDASLHWTIPLLFYNVTFEARDAFFGSGLGESIVVTSADGTELQVPLDANGEATIPRLSRGEYTVVVVGAGYSPPRPIYVSRDQAIEMKVVTTIDIATLLLSISTVVVALLLIGRPFLVTTPYRLAVHGMRSAYRRVTRDVRRWRWEGPR